MNIVPPIIGVFVLTGIMAAGLSSASTFLSVIGFSLSNDIVKFNYKNDRQQLWTSRWVMLVIGFIALLLAYFNPPAIRIISWFASTIIAASWGPVAFLSVWNKKITGRGALWGMLAGFFGYLGIESLNRFTDLSFSNFFHPFFIGVALNFIGIYTGSKTQPASENEKQFLQKMHIVPESEKDPALFQRDRLYGKIMIVAGVAFFLILLFNWVIPVNNF